MQRLFETKCLPNMRRIIPISKVEVINLCGNCERLQDIVQAKCLIPSSNLRRWANQVRPERRRPAVAAPRCLVKSFWLEQEFKLLRHPKHTRTPFCQPIYLRFSVVTALQNVCLPKDHHRDLNQENHYQHLVRKPCHDVCSIPPP